jgi:Domain of unknown function (DUF1918)
MNAGVGDWLVVHGRSVDGAVREGQVVEVPHADGSPPHVVRWTDTDRVSVVFTGPDTTVHERPPHLASAASRALRR